MVMHARVMTAAFAAGLVIASAAQAANWHRGWHGGNYHHYNNRGAVGAAIVGGIVGLGVGAAIASGGYGYYAPPPVYYGPPRGYYAPPPPAVYYGY